MPDPDPDVHPPGFPNRYRVTEAGGGEQVLLDAAGETIARVPPDRACRGRERATARLLSAAPVLLTALRQCVGAFGGVESPAADEALAYARDAIEEATDPRPTRTAPQTRNLFRTRPGGSSTPGLAAPPVPG